MKDFFSKSKGLMTLLLVIVVFFVVIYILQFHGGLSSEHLTWSQFGDIFNGIITPIFAAINICIFWYLTKVVDDNNAKRQSDKAIQDAELQQQNVELEKELQRQNVELEKELQRQNVEIESRLQEKDAELRTNLQQQNEKHEKAMILMQFRKAEIDRIEEAFSDAFVPLNIEGYDLLRPLFSLMYYLASFIKTKLVIFDLDEESTTAKNITQLIKDISNYTGFIANKNQPPQEITNRITELEYSVITDLQKITLGEKKS